MMRRRAMVGRRGPGVVGTVARTAVIAGTATAVSHGVSNRMEAREERKYQEQEAQAAAYQAQSDMEQMQAQMAQMQAQQVQAAAQQAAPSAGSPDLLGKLQQLSQLKDSGALTDEEYAAAKAKLLGT